MADPAQPHVRDLAVEAAVAELLPFFNGLIERHALTAVEYLFILNNCAIRQTQALCEHERRTLDGPKVGA